MGPATELHLEQHLDLAHPLHVLDADVDVLSERLLGQVEHMAREERLACTHARGRDPVSVPAGARARARARALRLEKGGLP